MHADIIQAWTDTPY